MNIKTGNNLQIKRSSKKSLIYFIFMQNVAHIPLNIHLHDLFKKKPNFFLWINKTPIIHFEFVSEPHERKKNSSLKYGLVKWREIEIG